MLGKGMKFLAESITNGGLKASPEYRKSFLENKYS